MRNRKSFHFGFILTNFCCFSVLRPNQLDLYACTPVSRHLYKQGTVHNGVSVAEVLRGQILKVTNSVSVRAIPNLSTEVSCKKISDVIKRLIYLIYLTVRD